MSFSLVPGMAALAADYDALIVDLWGVVHDGIAPYPGVLDCLERLRAANKRVIILSNAPRRAHHAIATLRVMGIGDGLYDRLVTSGDATRAALAERSDPFYAALGEAYMMFLGRGPDVDLLDDLAYRRVAAVADADFLLNTGLARRGDGSLGDPGDYGDVLRAAAARGLPMVCANPDLAVVRGGVREPCAGAVAAAYTALGGDVAYRGKPYPQVYDLCFEALGGIDRGRVLAVGDGLATDIAGARAAGIDSLLITGGLLADAWGAAREAAPDPARLAAACAEADAAPTTVSATFVW